MDARTTSGADRDPGLAADRPRRFARIRSIGGFVTITLALASCDTPRRNPPKDTKLMTIKITSSAFEAGSTIPKLYTCDDKNISPPIAWTGVPAEAKSLALICEDPDAPRGIWSHWVIYGIDPRVSEIAAGIEPAERTALKPGIDPAFQGKNDFGKIGYGGPCPPSGTHRYFFRLYALDRELELKPGATRDQVLKAIEGRIVAEGELMGKYAREK